MKKHIIHMVISGILSMGVNIAAAGDSTFEFYAKTSSQTLRTETGEMGTKLRNVFSQQAINTQQQKIDFAEYFSHLKKTVLYATKLATYSKYENDLQFAKDREIFKGLPEESGHPRKNDPPVDRKEFVRNKYDRMKKNIGEEIETYDDLILLSLDTCETIIENDLSGILDDSGNQEKIAAYIRGETYRKYKTKEKQFNQGWSALANRISAQLVMWGPKPPAMEDPILDPKIVGAI